MLADFAEANDLCFDLLPDPTQRIIRLYEARRRFGLGVSRITYVVDRAGIVAGAFHHEIHIRGHLRETLSVLRTLPTA